MLNTTLRPLFSKRALRVELHATKPPNAPTALLSVPVHEHKHTGTGMGDVNSAQEHQLAIGYCDSLALSTCVHASHAYLILWGGSDKVACDLGVDLIVQC